MMYPDECPFCLDSLSAMKTIRLDCCHQSIHLHCIRKVIRYVRDENRSRFQNDEATAAAAEAAEPFQCPNCLAEVSPETIHSLVQETRNLCFPYLLPKYVSGNPETRVRVLVKTDDHHTIQSQPFKVGHLPFHHEFKSQVVLIVDVELRVEDPNKQFRVWVEEVETRNRISQYHYIKTTALDHYSENEEGQEGEIIRDIPRHSKTRVIRNLTRRRSIRSMRRQPRPSSPLDISHRLRKRALHQNDKVTNARRAVRKAQDFLRRRNRELETAKYRFGEAMYDWLNC